MGIDIRWENESGKQLEEIPDPKNHFGFALALSPLEKTVCLRFIDPYGDTVFNQQQIPVFISELQALQQLVTSEQFDGLREKLKMEHQAYNSTKTEARTAIEISEHIARILELAQRSINKVHTYLKLYGD